MLLTRTIKHLWSSLVASLFTLMHHKYVKFVIYFKLFIMKCTHDDDDNDERPTTDTKCVQHEPATTFTSYNTGALPFVKAIKLFD